MSKGLWAYAPKTWNKRMKLSTQAAKHLVKKESGQFTYWRMPDWQAGACVFFLLKAHKPFYSLVGWRNELQRQKTINNLDLRFCIWNFFIEVGWLILTCLNEPVVGRNLQREPLFLLKCVHPTFSAMMYHFDWWISLVGFFTLSLPLSPTCLLAKTITQRPYCSKLVIFHPEWSCVPKDIWKCLETCSVTRTARGGKRSARGGHCSGHRSVYQTSAIILPLPLFWLGPRAPGILFHGTVSFPKWN